MNFHDFRSTTAKLKRQCEMRKCETKTKGTPRELRGRVESTSYSNAASVHCKWSSTRPQCSRKDSTSTSPIRSGSSFPHVHKVLIEGMTSLKKRSLQVGQRTISQETSHPPTVELEGLAAAAATVSLLLSTVLAVRDPNCFHHRRKPTTCPTLPPPKHTFPLSKQVSRSS